MADKDNKDLDKVKKYEQEADKYNASQIQVLGDLKLLENVLVCILAPLVLKGFTIWYGK